MISSRSTLSHSHRFSLSFGIAVFEKAKRKQIQFLIEARDLKSEKFYINEFKNVEMALKVVFFDDYWRIKIIFDNLDEGNFTGKSWGHDSSSIQAHLPLHSTV